MDGTAFKCHNCSLFTSLLLDIQSYFLLRILLPLGICCDLCLHKTSSVTASWIIWPPMSLVAWQEMTARWRLGVMAICRVDLDEMPPYWAGTVLLGTEGTRLPSRIHMRRETGLLVADSQVNVAVWPGRSLSGRTLTVTRVGGTAPIQSTRVSVIYIITKQSISNLACFSVLLPSCRTNKHISSFVWLVCEASDTE